MDSSLSLDGRQAGLGSLSEAAAPPLWSSSGNGRRFAAAGATRGTASGSILLCIVSMARNATNPKSKELLAALRKIAARADPMTCRSDTLHLLLLCGSSQGISFTLSAILLPAIEME
jgi:hypothetical protein